MKLRARVVGGQRAHIGREQITLLGERGAQRRQARESRLQGCLLQQNIGARSAAGGEPPLRDVELRLLRARYVLGGGDLRPQRSLGDRGGDHIGGEGEVACLERESRV